LASSAGTTGDSNVTYIVAQVRLWILHRLAIAANEAAYPEGAMQTDQRQLMDRAWWRVAGVYQSIDPRCRSAPLGSGT